LNLIHYHLYKAVAARQQQAEDIQEGLIAKEKGIITTKILLIK